MPRGKYGQQSTTFQWIKMKFVASVRTWGIETALWLERKSTPKGWNVRTKTQTPLLLQLARSKLQLKAPSGRDISSSSVGGGERAWFFVLFGRNVGTLRPKRVTEMDGIILLQFHNLGTFWDCRLCTIDWLLLGQRRVMKRSLCQ